LPPRFPGAPPRHGRPPPAPPPPPEVPTGTPHSPINLKGHRHGRDAALRRPVGTAAR
jgi:hypothetical protein